MHLGACWAVDSRRGVEAARHHWPRRHGRLPRRSGASNSGGGREGERGGGRDGARGEGREKGKGGAAGGREEGREGRGCTQFVHVAVVV